MSNTITEEITRLDDCQARMRQWLVKVDRSTMVKHPR